MSDGDFRKLLSQTRQIDEMGPGEEGGGPGGAGAGESDAVRVAIERLQDWVGKEVDVEAIRAVLWGAAMESKNSDVVTDAIKAMYDEHAGEMNEPEEEEPEPNVEPEVEPGDTSPGFSAEADRQGY